MAAFNYLSTLRENCDPAEDCGTESCRDMTCEELVACFEGYQDGDGHWRIGKEVVVRIYGVGNGSCEFCDSINGTYVHCADTYFDFWWEESTPCQVSRFGFAPENCSLETIQQYDVAINTNSGTVIVGWLLQGAAYGLFGADWQTALVKLCAGEVVTLPMYDQWNSHDGEVCEYDGSYATLQLRSVGESDCEPFVPTDDCVDMMDCLSDPPLLVLMSYFEDFDEVETESPFTGTRHWLMTNLNRGYFLPYTGAGTYEFAADLVTSTGDYDLPGVLIMRDECDDTDFAREIYVHKILIRIVCSDGEATIQYVNFYMQYFIKTEGPESDWVPNGDNVLWQASSADLELPSRVGVCEMPLASAFFNFQSFFVSGKGDESQTFLVNCTLGSIT